MFEAEQLTKSTDCEVIIAPWKQIFPPQICQVLLDASPAKDSTLP